MNNEMIEIMNEQQKDECPVCMEEYSFEKQPIEIGTCSHSVCGDCVEGMLTANNTVRDNTTGLRVLKCPICRASGKPTNRELTDEVVRLRAEVASLRTRPVQPRPVQPNPLQPRPRQVLVQPSPVPTSRTAGVNDTPTVFNILTLLARIRDEDEVSAESAANFVLLETDWNARLNSSNTWVDNGATRHQVQTALTQTREYVLANRTRRVPASVQRARERGNESFESALTEIRSNPVDETAFNRFALLDANWTDMLRRGVFLGEGEIATTRTRIQEAFNQTRAYVVANHPPPVQHPTLLTRGIGAVANVFASLTNAPLIPSPAPIHRFVGMPDHEVRFILRTLQPITTPIVEGEVGILGHIGNAERNWTVFYGHGTDARLWNTAPTVPHTWSGRIIAGRFYHNDFLIPRNTRGGSIAHRCCEGNPQPCRRRVGRRCPRGCGAFCCQNCFFCSNENCANMNQ